MEGFYGSFSRRSGALTFSFSPSPEVVVTGDNNGNY